MDDLKLYAKNELNINSLIQITRIYITDIDIGLDKYSRMMSKRGKMMTTEGVELLEGNIASVQDNNKYLQISRANAHHEEAARK